jgi:hypothetical protein
MSLTITRRGRHKLLAADGSVISQHTDIKEAYERASGLPPGSYTLVTADEVIVVTGAAPAPTPPPVPTPTPASEPPPVPEPPAPHPDPAPAGNLATVTAQGYTFTFSDTDVNPDGARVVANGEPVTNYSGGGPFLIYGDGYRVLNGIVYVHTKAGLWHGFTGQGWTTTPEGADCNPQPIALTPGAGAGGGWTPPPTPAPAIPPSPDGTIVTEPWQPISGFAGNPFEMLTLVMSDRKGTKDDGAHYIGYECCGVFREIDPKLAEGVAWTPATDDGKALAPTWIPLDEHYQPITDGRQHTWMALRAGEKYGYAFTVETAHNGILYQINGKGLCYGPTGAILDPLKPPPVVPAPAVGKLRLLGGWRLPLCWGSLAIDFSTMHAIVGTGDHTQAAPMLDLHLPPMGLGTDPAQWPITDHLGREKAVVGIRLRAGRDLLAWEVVGVSAHLLRQRRRHGLTGRAVRGRRRAIRHAHHSASSVRRAHQTRAGTRSVDRWRRQ